MAKINKKLNVSSEFSSDNFSKLFQRTMNDIINPADLPEQVLIPTGIEIFDTIIGGGILTGTYTSFAAPPGSGKSTFCLGIEREFKRLHPEGFIIHLDAEQCTSDERMRQLGVAYGYPEDDPRYDPRIYKISYGSTVEEVFKFVSDFIALKEQVAANEKDPDFKGIPTLIVWDSVDSSPTVKELEADSVENAIGQKPKQLGFFIRKHLRNFRKYNIAFITVNHISKKLNMQGQYTPYEGTLSSLKEFTIAGGKPVTYYPSNLIFLRGRENTKKIDEFIKSKYHLDSAFIVEATTLKCKNFSYNMSVELIFDTMRGFDNFTTKVHNMVSSEWFVADGRGYLLRNYNTFKFKLEDIHELYNTDETFKIKLDETWNDYIEERYGKFKQILKQLENQNTSMDLSEVLPNVDITVLKDLAAEMSNVKSDDEAVKMREAVFDLITDDTSEMEN